ncbi:MAG TPA: hypothetical protein VGR70_06560 [Stellaceae bacterium]|nr:hypothetical protein [Stellaceae bacterium]
MWRLQPRGAANRGVAVDADGAMLGPDCPLVQRTASGFRAASREPVRDMQCILGLDKDDPNWLYAQSQRIAEALDRSEIALAQIYGLRIPVRDLDGRQLKQLGALAPLAKADFNPDEPRLPAGQPGGGEWTTGGEAEAAPVSELRDSQEPSSAASPLVGGRWPAQAGPNTNPLLHPAQAEEDENARDGRPLSEIIDPLREVRRERYEWLRTQLRELEPDNRALQWLTGPDYSPSWADIDELHAALHDAQERAAEPPSTAWERGPALRGIEAELWRLGGQSELPSNTPTIDHFTEDGIAISIKSIDLNAPWYRDPLNLSRQIDRYVNKLASFDGLDWGRTTIRPDEITGKVLDVVVPKNSGTAAQREAIAKSIERAERRGIHVLVSFY